MAREETRDREQRHVRADAVECGLPVGEQARVAEQEIEPHRRDRDDKNLRREPWIAADRMDNEREDDEAE
jgi:hypothetical protein